MPFQSAATQEQMVESHQSARLQKPDTVAKTVPWSVDRWGRLLAGSGIMLATTLGILHNPAWLGLALLSSGNLVLTSITDHCVLRNTLLRLGAREREDLFLPGGVPRSDLNSNSSR